MEQDIKYLAYRKLPQKQKERRIKQAEQSQSFRRPNPQGNHKFPQNNFINFIVKQKKQVYQLHTYRYKAQNEAKAIVIMFHGLNSHIGHGAHIAYYFSKAAIETVGFDYRGFGQSSGDEGYLDSFQQHLKDCNNFVNKIKQLYPSKPIFALGLSLGGMTAYHLSLRDSKIFQGVILMAPALKNSIGGFLVNLTGFLQTVLPKKVKLTKPIYGKAAKNPQVTEDVQSDPYAFSGRARLSTVSMLVDVMDKSPQTFKFYKAPFIIFQGGLDKLVNPEVAFQLYDQSLSKDKDIVFYEGMWHDVWHEEQIYEIIDKSIQWISKRVQ